MWHLIKDILYNLDTIGPLCVLVYFLISKAKLEGAFLWFILFVAALFVSNLVSLLEIEIPRNFGNKKPLNNLFIYHIGCIAYVFTLYKFFSKILTLKSSKIIDILFLIPFAILSVYNFIYFTRTFTIYGLTSIWVAVKCLSYYAQKFKDPDLEDILESWIFWVVSGMFLYFTVTFFIFISYDFFTIGILRGTLSPIVSSSWLVGNIILALSCAFYIKGARCKQ